MAKDPEGGKMKIKLELTPAQALALEDLASYTAEDINDIIMDKRKIKTAKRALRILSESIPRSIRLDSLKRSERSNKKFDLLMKKIGAQK